MELIREYDVEIVNSILPSDSQFGMAPKFIHFMVVYDDEKVPCGCFVLVPHSDICVFIHTFFLPRAYRKMVTPAKEMVLDYIFNQVGWTKLLTEVPIFNTLAKKLATSVGMVKEGYMKQSYKDKNGIHDVELFGMTKGEYLCQSQ